MYAYQSCACLHFSLYSCVKYMEITHHWCSKVLDLILFCNFHKAFDWLVRIDFCLADFLTREHILNGCLWWSARANLHLQNCSTVKLTGPWGSSSFPRCSAPPRSSPTPICCFLLDKDWSRDTRGAWLSACTFSPEVRGKSGCYEWSWSGS